MARSRSNKRQKVEKTVTTTTTGNYNYFPNDLTRLVFQFAGFSDFVNLKRINKHWSNQIKAYFSEQRKNLLNAITVRQTLENHVKKPVKTGTLEQKESYVDTLKSSMKSFIDLKVPFPSTTFLTMQKELKEFSSQELDIANEKKLKTSLNDLRKLLPRLAAGDYEIDAIVQAEAALKKAQENEKSALEKSAKSTKLNKLRKAVVSAENHLKVVYANNDKNIFFLFQLLNSGITPFLFYTIFDFKRIGFIHDQLQKWNHIQQILSEKRKKFRKLQKQKTDVNKSFQALTNELQSEIMTCSDSKCSQTTTLAQLLAINPSIDNTAASIIFKIDHYVPIPFFLHDKTAHARDYWSTQELEILFGFTPALIKKLNQPWKHSNNHLYHINEFFKLRLANPWTGRMTNQFKLNERIASHAKQSLPAAMWRMIEIFEVYNDLGNKEYYCSHENTALWENIRKAINADTLEFDEKKYESITGQAAPKPNQYQECESSVNFIQGVVSHPTAEQSAENTNEMKDDDYDSTPIMGLMYPPGYSVPDGKDAKQDVSQEIDFNQSHGNFSYPTLPMELDLGEFLTPSVSFPEFAMENPSDENPDFSNSNSSSSSSSSNIFSSNQSASAMFGFFSQSDIEDTDMDFEEDLSLRIK